MFIKSCERLITMWKKPILHLHKVTTLQNNAVWSAATFDCKYLDHEGNKYMGISSKVRRIKRDINYNHFICFYIQYQWFLNTIDLNNI